MTPACQLMVTCYNKELLIELIKNLGAAAHTALKIPRIKVHRSERDVVYEADYLQSVFWT